MKLKFFLTIFILAGFTLITIAQDEVPELVTDRPDQTESSVTVPLKSLQIETGFVVENDETESVKQKSLVYNTTLLRYGLLERMELRLGLSYLSEKVEIKNTDTTNTISGYSPLYAGFKIYVTEEKGWIPEIAFLAGLQLPFTAHHDFRLVHSSANMRFAFSHTLSERFSLGYNLGVEWDNDDAVPNYYYSMVLGVAVSDKLSAFVEGFGYIPEGGDAEHLVDAGFTWLLFPNLQLDFSGGLGLNDKAIDNFISLGLSWRIPE